MEPNALMDHVPFPVSVPTSVVLMEPHALMDHVPVMDIVTEKL
jgi:hypothetical protein